MRCPECYARNARKHSFCYNCGAALYQDDDLDMLENEYDTDELPDDDLPPARKGYSPSDSFAQTTPAENTSASSKPANIPSFAPSPLEFTLDENDTEDELDFPLDVKDLTGGTEDQASNVRKMTPLHAPFIAPALNTNAVNTNAVNTNAVNTNAVNPKQEDDPVQPVSEPRPAPVPVSAFVPKTKASTGAPVVINPMGSRKTTPAVKTVLPASPAANVENADGTTRQVPVVAKTADIGGTTRQMRAISLDSLDVPTSIKPSRETEDEPADETDMENDFGDMDEWDETPRKKRRSRKQQELEDNWNGEDIDYDAYDAARYHEETPRGMMIRRILQISLLVVVLAVVTGVAIYTVQNLPLIMAYFGSSAPSASPGEMTTDDPASLPPTVEAFSTSDGSAAHRIVFFGKEGDKIKIPTINQFFPVIDGQAVVDILDSKWLEEAKSQGAESEIINVDIPAILYRDNIEWFTIPVSYAVKSPVTTLVLLSPSSNPYTTTDRQVEIRLQVSPGAQVKIGNDEYTSLVSAEGILVAKVDLGTGENHITIWAHLRNSAEATIDLVVTRPEMDVKLSIDNPPPPTTEAATVVIRGNADLDAVITSSATIEGEVTKDEYGNFEFTVSLIGYGKNVIDVTATAEGKGASTLSVTVERLPNVEEYSKKAWKMDYPYLSTSTSSLIGKIFRCEGKVLEMLNSEDPDMQLFVFDVGTSAEQKLVIECRSSVTIEVGKSYTIFADVVGTHEKLPKLIGRFVNKK